MSVQRTLVVRCLASHRRADRRAEWFLCRVTAIHCGHCFVLVFDPSVEPAFLLRRVVLRVLPSLSGWGSALRIANASAHNSRRSSRL